MNSYQKGIAYEEKAKSFLAKLGVTIFKHRYKTPYGEIDLIGTKDDSLIAFEVKGRKKINDAAFALQDPQKKRILEAFAFFMQQNPHLMKKYPFQRVDVVLISDHNDIRHIPNACTRDFEYN